MMAGGLAAGASPAPANPAASARTARQAAGPEPGDPGFHALLGGALPAGTEAAEQVEAGQTLAPATPGSPVLQDAGVDEVAPEAPPPGAITLAEQVLVLIGVSVPPIGAAEAGPGAALPADGAAPGPMPRNAGPAVVTAQGIAGATLNPTAASALDGAAGGLPPEALQGSGAPGALLPPMPELASSGPGPEADPGATAGLLAGQAPAAPPRSAILPPALAAPLPMPADPEAGFDDAFGARIGWMAGQQIGRAEIRLNPEHLGVVDIRLDLDGSRVSVELASASHDVRQALEASLGRLRDMLEQQGLDLARADVGAGQRDGHAGHSAATPERGPDGGAGGDRTAPEDSVPLRRRGLLDEYA